MKFLLFFTVFLSQAYAVPVLNRNMAAEGTFVTIWPDHKDPDHFYFAPNFMKIAVGPHGEPKFHFTQYRTGNCSSLGNFRGKCHTKAMINSLLIAGYELEQLTDAQAGIRKLRPLARFSAIPFIASRVEFGTALNEFIAVNDCTPQAGQAADEVPCNLTLNNRGVHKLKPFLSSGRILPFKFNYKIQGVNEVAAGVFEAQALDYGLTVNLGGEMLIDHPELASKY